MHADQGQGGIVLRQLDVGYDLRDEGVGVARLERKD